MIKMHASFLKISSSLTDRFKRKNGRFVLMGFFLFARREKKYRSGTVNSNTVNSKFHLIRSFFEIFARFLSFHV